MSVLLNSKFYSFELDTEMLLRLCILQLLAKQFRVLKTSLKLIDTDAA